MNPEFAVLSVGKSSMTPVISTGTSQPDTLTIWDTPGRSPVASETPRLMTTGMTPPADASYIPRTDRFLSVPNVNTPDRAPVNGSSGEV